MDLAHCVASNSEDRAECARVLACAGSISPDCSTPRGVAALRLAMQVARCGSHAWAVRAPWHLREGATSPVHESEALAVQRQVRPWMR